MIERVIDGAHRKAIWHRRGIVKGERGYIFNNPIDNARRRLCGIGGLMELDN